MLSGRVMLVSSQCHCNSLNVNPKRCGGETDFGSEMLNLANPYSEAAKTSKALPRFLLEIPTVPAGTSGSRSLASLNGGTQKVPQAI
jgi:hypothetical protein